MLDRMVHRLAFSVPHVQMAVADIERALYGRRYRHLPVNEPVFIASLPRAGTTLLLEVLGREPRFATHRYRDMPFVLAPVLWDTFSGPFRKQAKLRERAHGDGVMIGYDSPEAFEEVIWRAFWPEKFRPDRILTWHEDDEREGFPQFFADHMRKVIVLRSGGGGGDPTGVPPLRCSAGGDPGKAAGAPGSAVVPSRGRICRT